MEYQELILDMLNRIVKLEKEVENLKKTKMPVEFTSPETAKEDKPQQRDKTRYMFNGNIYLKNKLVLAIVKDYVSKNRTIKCHELKTVFDKSLQGSRNVVETMENAQKISDCAKRYFVKDAIPLKDGTIVVVCTQWGIFNIVKFEKLAESLGYNINKV